jgi:hypothetical protein
MAYGEIKVDTITFTDGGIDKSVSISGLVQNPTFSGNITVTGTISGDTLQGQTVSGVTVTGTTAAFTSGTFTTITGGTATITSGVFASGTAAAPSVSVGTTDNGIYSPGTDQVAVATNGVGRLFVDASGRVGVGTTAPQTLLHVADGSPVLRLQDTAAAGDPFSQVSGNNGNLFLLADDGNDIADTRIQFDVDGTERVRIDENGRLLVGTASARAISGLVHKIQTETATGSGSGRIAIGTNNNVNNTGPGIYFFRSRGGALGSNTIVQDDDIVGSLFFQGADGTDIDSRAADISAVIDGTPGANDMPGRLVFSTTADGASSPTERLRITSAGLVGIGTTSPDVKLHVEGATAGGAGVEYFDALQLENTQTANVGAARLKFKTNRGGTAGETSIAHVPYDGSGNAYLRLQAFQYQFYNQAGSSEYARIDNSGRLLVGTSTAPSAVGPLQIVDTVSSVLVLARNDTSIVAGNGVGQIRFLSNDSTAASYEECATIAAAADGTFADGDKPTRLVFSTTADGASSPTERMRIKSDGFIEFATANLKLGGGNASTIFRSGGDGSGLHFTTNAIVPTNETGTISDNTESWGNASYRWTVIYATTGTINTSDANEKQDIQNLSDAELAVARELKNLFKTFRWKEAVAEKGDNARIHVGVIAQDVQQLFAEHGLDVTKYGIWCSDTWYEVDGMGIASDGTPYTADSEGAVLKTRLGIRYEELLSFVLAAL